MARQSRVAGSDTSLLAVLSGTLGCRTGRKLHAHPPFFQQTPTATFTPQPTRPVEGLLRTHALAQPNDDPFSPSLPHSGMRAAGEPPSAPGEAQVSGTCMTAGRTAPCPPPSPRATVLACLPPFRKRLRLQAPHAPAQMHHNPCVPCPEAGPQQPAASPRPALELHKTTEAGWGPSARGTVQMPPPPPKPCGPSPAGLPAGLTSGLTCSSQREAMTGAPSRLMSGSDGGSDDKQDEYLLRLLRKGAPAPPPAQQQQQQQQQPPSSQQPQQQEQQQGAPPTGLHPQQHPQQQQQPQQQESQGFRAPGPVRRASTGSGSLVAAGPAAAAMLASPSRMLMRQTSNSMASPSGPAGTHTNGNGATVPSMSQPTATTNDQAVPAACGGGGAVTPAAAPAVAAAAARAASHPLPPTSQTPLQPAAGEAAAAANNDFAVTRRLLGDEVAFSVRNTMVR